MGVQLSSFTSWSIHATTGIPDEVGAPNTILAIRGVIVEHDPAAPFVRLRPPSRES